ncbi:MAG: anti-sigma B factor antagonist [Arenicella sp.]|jgi:anti-sigma B factor antagonist
MFLNTEEHGDIIVVKLPQRFLAETVQNFKSVIQTSMEQAERDFILDFRATDMVDSSALGAIVAAYKSISLTKRVLVLSSLNDTVRTLFELTQLQKVFLIEDSLEAALANLKKRS